MLGQTRVHLDRVEGLGEFVELEVILRPDQDEGEGVAIAQGLMARLGIAEGQLVHVAYIDLMGGGSAEVLDDPGAGPLDLGRHPRSSVP